jgi:hypothetical protein
VKEQVLIVPGADKSKASVREPLDGAFCHLSNSSTKVCCSVAAENTVFRLLHCNGIVLPNWHETDITCQRVDVDDF